MKNSSYPFFDKLYSLNRFSSIFFNVFILIHKESILGMQMTILILAVKECFFDDEIRCILIKKTKNGRKVKYFSRSCTNTAAGDQTFLCISTVCY